MLAWMYFSWAACAEVCLPPFTSTSPHQLAQLGERLFRYVASITHFPSCQIPNPLFQRFLYSFHTEKLWAWQLQECVHYTCLPYPALTAHLFSKHSLPQPPDQKIKAQCKSKWRRDSSLPQGKATLLDSLWYLLLLQEASIPAGSWGQYLNNITVCSRKTKENRERGYKQMSSKSLQLSSLPSMGNNVKIIPSFKG